jgi:hypothetical protein
MTRAKYMEQSYCYAALGRFDFGLFRVAGSGLGNLLFAWARCIIAAREFGLAPLFPAWFNISPRAILVGRREKRFYAGFFHPTGGYITGIKRIALLCLSKHYCEHDLRKRAKPVAGGLYVFSGMGERFGPIRDHHELLFRELRAMTKEKHRKGLSYPFEPGIVVHVRCGDFHVPQGVGDLRSGSYNCRIPLSWYADIVKQLRSRTGSFVPVYIFSDGTDAELKDLLCLPGIRRIGFGSAIADMLALARGNVLVASASTFSMWASFFGRMPVVWFKGQMRQRLYNEHESAEIEVDMNEPLSESFCSIAAEHLFASPMGRPVSV